MMGKDPRDGALRDLVLLYRKRIGQKMKERKKTSKEEMAKEKK